MLKKIAVTLLFLCAVISVWAFFSIEVVDQESLRHGLDPTKPMIVSHTAIVDTPIFRIIRISTLQPNDSKVYEEIQKRYSIEFGGKEEPLRNPRQVWG